MPLQPAGSQPGTVSAKAGPRRPLALMGYFGKLFLLPEPFDLVDLRIRFLPNLFEAQAN